MNIIFNKEKDIPYNFSEITLSLASPESILSRSQGEVNQPETINYKTHKPEFKGLFCEKIFGPTKDWECHCGKYKKIRYKNVICDRCGVEVTEKKVRRERTGHIELIVPVVHIWYFKSLNNKIGHLLGLSGKVLEKVIYYEDYIVIQAGLAKQYGIQDYTLINEESYKEIKKKISKEQELLSDDNPDKFIVKIGGEAIEYMLSKLNLEKLSSNLRTELEKKISQQKRIDSLKRLKVVEQFLSGNRKIKNEPKWMVVRILNVLPPELRPLVALEAGKFATADLNELYRRIIVRNNRLKRFIEIKAPEIILRNEKRLLQEAVDALFDNAKKITPAVAENNRALKSLSDNLKGKQGRFRQNLLGKRVDYSGRSVIVVGPELKLYECGIPKYMAAELFKPFIMKKIIDRGLAITVKHAKKIVENKHPIIWDILEKILEGYPVLLNRAPTLHRLGIQAFQPKLVEGKAIQLHPLVCTAFNADFDGDSMALHLPLTQEAIAEARLLLLSAHNILNPANGNSIVMPSKDIILGLYYLTKGKKSTATKPMKNENKIFYGEEEVILALNHEKVANHTYIKLRTKIKNEEEALEEKIICTVAGRVIFNQFIPKEMGFVNKLITSKEIQKIVIEVYHLKGNVYTVNFLDQIKLLGFDVAYKGGLSISLDNVKIPNIKFKIIEEAKKEITKVMNTYLAGLITNGERYNQVINIWTKANEQIKTKLIEDLEKDQEGFNSMYMMMDSGARGSREQISQLCGLRGLMAKSKKAAHNDIAGEIIENPILSNFKEGLDVMEYSISTHGARKGLADTALKTADAGYLTRRLVDVAQDVIILQEDCNTLSGKSIKKLQEEINQIDETFYEKILGRIALNQIVNPDTQEIIVPEGEEINELRAKKIFQNEKIQKIKVRTPLYCKAKRGICKKCYGRNLATGNLIQIGDPVGLIAAQSIGEPGTQLTLRTFQVGGAAANVSTESLINSKFDGVIKFDNIKYLTVKDEKQNDLLLVTGRLGEIQIYDKKKSGNLLSTIPITYGMYLRFKDGDSVKKGEEICFWDPYNAIIIANQSGKIEFKSIEEGITLKKEYNDQTGHEEFIIQESKDKKINPSILIVTEKGEKNHYNLPIGAYLQVKDQNQINQGDILAKIPRKMSTSKDITGGLPRVNELFEVRNPSNPAIVSEIDGYVLYGEIKRGKQEIFIESKDHKKVRYLIPVSKHIVVQNNDFVKSGTVLSEGNVVPDDILTIQGAFTMQEYLLKELQEVYELQGVKINDKHIEIIIRQMMQKREIINNGDTVFLPGQIIHKNVVEEENAKILNSQVVLDPGDSQYNTGQLVAKDDIAKANRTLVTRNQKPIQVRDANPAISKPQIQGITQASLYNESFLAAASFQETTKVLSDAAVQAKSDPMLGLKENIITGHLIPAGTGLKQFDKLKVVFKEDYQDLVKDKMLL